LPCTSRGWVPIPAFLYTKVFLSFLLLSLVIHPSFVPYFGDHLSVINHPTLSLLKINAIICLALDPLHLVSCKTFHLSTFQQSVIHQSTSSNTFHSSIFHHSFSKTSSIDLSLLSIPCLQCNSPSCDYPSSFTS
jgi:hypothetical protein